VAKPARILGVCVMASALLCAPGVAIGQRLLGGRQQITDASELAVSVSDRFQAFPTVLVAGRVVNLVASLHILYGDTGCERDDLVAGGAPVTATVELPAGVQLQGTASATQIVPLPKHLARDVDSGGAPAVINFRWPVQIAQPGAYRGLLTVTASGRGGRICTGGHDFTIAAVTGGPRFRVVDAYIDDGVATAVLAAMLPTNGLPRGVANYALSDALAESHDPLGEDFGREAIDVLSLRWRGRALELLGGGTWTAGSYTCVQFRRPLRMRVGTLVRYRLRFDWNNEKGFATRERSGRLRLKTRPRTHQGKTCERHVPADFYENIQHL
jgi:hypothetical protein